VGDFWHSEQTLCALLESAGQGIVGVDSAGAIILVNTMLERLFGYSRDELLGQQLEILIPETLRDRHGKHRLAYFQKPRVRPMGEGLALTGRRKDGTEFPVEVSLSSVETSVGLLSVGFISDITARERAEADLQQFAYVVSHDLQEPVRNIAAFAELLTRNYGELLDEQGREFVGFIQQSTSRMSALISGLLSYSRITKDRESAPLTEVALDDVLSTAAGNLRVAMDEAQAAIHADPLPVVSGDPIQLTQLFQNLLSNSLKYRAARPPAVRITSTESDGGYVIAVEDNGIGIPPRHLERVFGLYQRLHGSEYPGNGIGLAICKQIVERHGGRMWAEPSESGAVIKFALRKPPAG
jgi:PAS domain S-box-containing protein